MNKIYKTIDLFAGIGGIRFGFEASKRTKNVFSAEIDKAACESYKLNFNENPYCDVTKLTEEQIKAIKDFDILLAGFPCQAFSTAGKGNGFNDDRGKLFFDIVRILTIKKPRAVFLENVKGLISNNGGESLKTILEILKERLNYNVSFKVLNSKDFGVPQNRERIYIIGFRNKENFVFPQLVKKKAKVRPADILEKKDVSVKYYLSQKYLDSLKVRKAKYLSKGGGFGYKIIEDSGIASTITAGGMGKERNLIIDDREKNSELSINSELIRNMTPMEWARLQGYPDSFKLHPINTHAYRQLGNSVTVPVITAIADNIIKVLDKEPSIRLI